MDCFVARAPRNDGDTHFDGETHLHILAARGAQGMRESLALKSEGVGNAGRRCTRSLACKVESTRV